MIRSIFNRICDIQKSRNINYTLFITIKDTLISVVLVFLQSLPIVQLTVLSGLFFIQLILILILKPLKKTKHNVLQFLNCLWYLMIMGLFWFIYIFDEVMNIKTKTLFIGIPILLILLLMFIGNVIVNIIFAMVIIEEKIKIFFAGAEKSVSHKGI